MAFTNNQESVDNELLDQILKEIEESEKKIPQTSSSNKIEGRRGKNTGILETPEKTLSEENETVENIPLPSAETVVNKIVANEKLKKEEFEKKKTIRKNVKSDDKEQKDSKEIKKNGNKSVKQSSKVEKSSKKENVPIDIEVKKSKKKGYSSKTKEDKVKPVEREQSKENLDENEDDQTPIDDIPQNELGKIVQQEPEDVEKHEQVVENSKKSDKQSKIVGTQTEDQNQVVEIVGLKRKSSENSDIETKKLKMDKDFKICFHFQSFDPDEIEINLRK